MHAVAASVAGEVARNRTSNCSRCDAKPLVHLRHLSGTAWPASRPAGVHAQASSPPPQWRGLNVTMPLQRAQASREAALRVRAQNASRPAASHGARPHPNTHPHPHPHPHPYPHPHPLTRGTAARRTAAEHKPLGFELWASGAHRHRAPAPAAGSDSSSGGPSAREPRGGQGEARRGGGRGRQRARGSASPPGLPRRGGGLQESPIHGPAREWRAVSAVVKRDEADVRCPAVGERRGVRSHRAQLALHDDADGRCVGERDT